MKLDLACGGEPAGGFVGVDIVAPPGAAMHMADSWCRADLFAPRWPFRDDSIDEVRCSHFVEHVPNLVGFMDELWRVLVDDGLAVIQHPYQFSVRAWQDPTHVRALNEVSWSYFSAAWRATNGLGHYPIAADYTVEHVEFIGSGRWAHVAPSTLAKAAREQINVVDDLRVRLRARK